MKELALVTGAVHRLGRAIALALAARGYAIGLHYHSSRAAEHTSAELLAAGAAAVYPLRADLRVPAQIDGLFAAVADLPHPLSVLVNSASVMQRGSLRDLPVDDWDGTLDLNLRAPWLCARAAARLMEPEGGTIINLTDSGAHKAWATYPAYIVSKAGLEALTRLLAKTLAPAVRVNAVAPGLILPAPDMPPETWQRLVDRLPLQAAGVPEDVARAVLFLIDNSYITGQTLVVDGGYQLI
jgi:NAD(P)-dependent dehydrogenase (short-subunit alcohol dehydrogenase family)